MALLHVWTIHGHILHFRWQSKYDFFIASEPVRKPCIHDIIFNFSRILVTAL